MLKKNPQKERAFLWLCLTSRILRLHIPSYQEQNNYLTAVVRTTISLAFIFLRHLHGRAPIGPLWTIKDPLNSCFLWRFAHGSILPAPGLSPPLLLEAAQWSHSLQRPGSTADTAQAQIWQSCAQDKSNDV